MSSSYEYVLLVFVKENIKIFRLIALCLAVYRARPRLLSPNALRSLMVLIGGMREMSCFTTRFPAVTTMTRLLPLGGHECGRVEAQNVGSYSNRKSKCSVLDPVGHFILMFLLAFPL